MKELLICILLFSVLLATSCTDERSSDQQKIPVTVYVVEPGMISEVVNAPCRLEAGSEAVVSIAVPSVVEEVLIASGDTVIAGQRLLVLKNDDLHRAMICDAAAMLTAARASSDYAQGNLQRAIELMETGAISAGEFERVQTEARASSATFQQAAASYSASAASAMNGFVLAPFDGVVGRVIATQGNRAEGPLLSIYGTTVIKAELLIAPRHIHKLRIGLPVVFTTDHFPGRAFPGSVVSVSETADVVSGLVALTVQFTDTTATLIPGLSGTAMILLDTRENAVVLPGSMMSFLDENSMEVAIVQDGTATKIVVETGIRNGISYEITSGLFPGDSVISLGHALVSEGTPIRVVGQ